MTQYPFIISNCITFVMFYISRSSEGSNTSVAYGKTICCSADWLTLTVTLLKGLIVRVLLHKERSQAILTSSFIDVEAFHDLTLFCQGSFGPYTGRLFGNQPKEFCLGFVHLSFLTSVQAIIVFQDEMISCKVRSQASQTLTLPEH